MKGMILGDDGLWGCFILTRAWKNREFIAL